MRAAVISANDTRLLNKQFDQMLKPVINKLKGLKKYFLISDRMSKSGVHITD